MRFRSLVLDYKAEAVQIMREESNRETKRRRVIRIISNSLNESPGKGEIQTTSTPQNANSDARALPSWLLGSPSNQNNSSADPFGGLTNAIVTPIGKSTISANKTGGEEVESLGKSGINDCNLNNSRQDIVQEIGNENTNHKSRRTFDYTKLFSTPWLLEFVSSIRRRANRRRISNVVFQETSRCVPFSYHDRCPNDSFFFFHRKILRRLIDECCCRRSNKNSLNQPSLDRETQLYAEPNAETETKPCNEERFALSAFVDDRKGSFSSLSLPNRRPSTAIVVYRGHSTTLESPTDPESNKSAQRLPLNGNSTSVPLKLWETAILTAAAICAYQQQQQQQQQQTLTTKTTKEESLHENMTLGGNGNRKICCTTPVRHEYFTRDEPKKKLPTLEQSPNYIRDQEKDFDSLHPHDQNKTRRISRSTSVEKVIFSEICRPRNDSVVETKKRKRSLSLRMPEDEGFLLSQLEDQSETNNSCNLNHANDTDLSHDTKSDPSPDCNTRNTDVSLESTPKNSRREKCRKNELFLLQRFGLLQNKNIDDEKSIQLATNARNGFDSDSSVSGAIPDDRNSGNVGLSVSDEDGYTSPIEFPVCFDEYDEENEQEDGFNPTFSTEVAEEANSVAHSTQENQTPCCDRDFERSNAPSEIDIVDGKLKTDSHSVVNHGNGNGVRKSSKKKKNGKKKRRRTAEEKIFRKKEKRRKGELESMKNSKAGVKEGTIDRTDDVGSDNEGEKLETPRKLDFKEFSPAKTSTDRAEHQSSTPEFGPTQNTPKQLFPETEATVPPIEDENTFEDPFSIDPNEILETITCTPQVKIQKDEKLRANTLVSIATDDRHSLHVENSCQSISSPHYEKNTDREKPINVLCSETFIENFGETMSEITRSNSTLGTKSFASHQRSIQFIDTSLVDVCSVDIEIPSRAAMVVSTVSQIQHSGGLMAFFLPRIVNLAAQNRYNDLVVFLCVDVILDSTTARDLVRLQSAFLSCDRGLPRTQTKIQVCSKRSLAAFISKNIFHLIESGNCPSPNVISNVDQWLSDERTCQRLKFLLSIIPTLSVMGALFWLEICVDRATCSPLRHQIKHSSKGDKTSKWFQQVFQNTEMEKRRLESHLLSSNIHRSKSKLKDFLNPIVPNQLASAVYTRLRHE